MIVGIYLKNFKIIQGLTIKLPVLELSKQRSLSLTKIKISKNISRWFLKIYPGKAKRVRNKTYTRANTSEKKNIQEWKLLKMLKMPKNAQKCKSVLYPSKRVVL